jgi:DNA-binding IclR family transcriptional regulator
MRTNRSVQRALEILELIARARRPLSFSELLQQLDLPKASLHNLLATLEGNGFLDREAVTGRYTVGLGAFEVGSAYPIRRDVRDAAAPVLKRLSAEHNETCHFGILDRGDVVYIDRLDSTREVRLATAIGKRVPAYATGIGKALLSCLTADEVDALYPDELPPLVPNTIRRRSDLVEELTVSHARGYALDDEESTAGVRCVAAAVAVDGWPRVALSLAFPVQRATMRRLNQLGPQLRTAAAEIADRLTIISSLGEGVRVGPEVPVTAAETVNRLAAASSLRAGVQGGVPAVTAADSPAGATRAATSANSLTPSDE